MTLKFFAAVSALVLLSACGSGDKKSDSAPAAEAPAPIVDFKSMSGLKDSADPQNVCPYVELTGSYKIGSSDCTLGGKKADVDYLLVPTRYSISEIVSGKGFIEVQFTRDGSELSNDSMEFPRIQTQSHERKQGVQCAMESETDTLKLFHACIGNKVSSSCFNAIVKKDGKLQALVSRMKGGMQYWCKSTLRKVEDAQE